MNHFLYVLVFVDQVLLTRVLILVVSDSGLQLVLLAVVACAQWAEPCLHDKGDAFLVDLVPHLH